MTASSIVRALSAIILVAAFSACDDPTDPVANEQELITDVTITLTPVGGGAAIVSTIADPDGAGPNPPNAQTAAIALEPLAVRLVDPPRARLIERDQVAPARSVPELGLLDLEQARVADGRLVQTSPKRPNP